MTAVLAVAVLAVFGLGVAVAASPPEPTAEPESGAPGAAGVFKEGARSLIWYSGAPQLQGLHEYLSTRLTELHVESAQWDGSGENPRVQVDKPYDLLVLAAGNRQQLAEWQKIAPEARVVLSVVPDGDDVRFEMKITFGLQTQRRVVHVSERAELLDQIDQIESASETRTTSKKQDGDAIGQQEEANTDVPATQMQRAQMQTLRKLISCIYAALGDLDLAWSITIGPDGSIQSIAISGNGLATLYNILACW
ncbi:MAG TPA: hypothetical protein VM243_13185 [Phycisphaerae bacterium]|nr:hypothetical protein [Phycisphaerae bacterium]